MDDNPNLPAYAVESAISRKALLETLFGSKCLPDEEYTTCVHASGTACKHYNHEEHHCLLHGECKFEPFLEIIATEVGNIDSNVDGDQDKNWNKWLKGQNSKVPKTWSELVKHIQPILYAEISHKSDGHYISVSEDCGNTPIEKSALALLKINQLIEVGYGGNVTNKEWETLTPYYIWYNTADKCFMINTSTLAKIHIAFHTREQAEGFLKYPENIQLLKDYFIV